MNLLKVLNGQLCINSAKFILPSANWFRYLVPSSDQHLGVSSSKQRIGILPPPVSFFMW